MPHPDIKCNVNMIYNSSFSGSVLWDMEGRHTSQLVNSWSVAVRHTWDIPMNSHMWFMESLGGTHTKVMFVTRYINFIQSIQKSSRTAVLLLFQKCKNNLLTVTGRNVDFVQKEVNHPDILTMKIKDVKKSYSENQFSIEELDDIINFIVTS